MKKLIAVSVLVSFLVSCQKGISWDDLNTGGGNGKKLVKLTQKSGTDSSVANYTYNSSNSLTEYSAVQTTSGQTADFDIVFARNSSNIITQSTVTSTQLTQLGIDKIATNYIYDAANSRYKYSITIVTILGTTYKDSILYSYDANNRFINGVEYADDGTGYSLDSKEEYVYTGANVTTLNEYSYNDLTSSYDLSETDALEYDSKTNPFQFTTDAIPLRVIDVYSTFYSANNVAKETSVTTSPVATNVATFTYTYNANNLPATAVIAQASGTTAVTYFYQ